MIQFRVWDVRAGKEVENVQGFRVIKKVRNGVEKVLHFQVYHGPDEKTTFTKFAPPDVRIQMTIFGNYHNIDDTVMGVLFQGDSLTIDFQNAGTQKYYRQFNPDEISEGQKAIEGNQNLSIP